MSPSAGAPRLVRAAVLAWAAVGLSVVAHTTGGGHLPALLPGALLTVVVTCTALVATRWRLSRTVLVGLLGGSQLVLHEVLGALGTGRCQPAGPAHVGHDSAHALAPAVAAACAGSGPAHQGGPPMVLTHAAATVVLALLLAHGEQLAWQVCWLLTPLVAIAVAPVLVTTTQRSPVRSTPSARPPRDRVPPAAPRRGPPPLAALA